MLSPHGLRPPGEFPLVLSQSGSVSQSWGISPVSRTWGLVRDIARLRTHRMERRMKREHSKAAQFSKMLNRSQMGEKNWCYSIFFNLVVKSLLKLKWVVSLLAEIIKCSVFLRVKVEIKSKYCLSLSRGVTGCVEHDVTYKMSFSWNGLRKVGVLATSLCGWEDFSARF